ncbi:MAG: sulfur carrier protein ThiS [Gemmatimonadota bacterium]
MTPPAPTDTRTVGAELDLVVNGRPRRAAAGTTVAGLLAAHGLQADLVVVEHNGAILPRAALAITPLADGDALEIVQFVGGG